MKRLLPLMVLFAVFATLAQAFQIELPKHYHEDLAKKQEREKQILWRELDRSAVEVALRAFVAQNPMIDGVDLSHAAERLVWCLSSDGTAIKVGSWIVILKEWEYSFPPLKRIRWDRAELFVEIPYDYKTKELGTGGDAFVRLCFKLKRAGSLFSKKVLRVELQYSDFGEITIIWPLGGTALQRANQRPEGTPGESSPSKPSQVPVVPHP